jgi:putative ABC transport system permease protein
MLQGDVTPFGLAASLLLVGVAVAVSAWQRLGLGRSVAWAALRAIVQLLLVGTALALIIDPHRSLAWSWAWAAAMTMYAGDVVRRRAPEIPGVLPLAAAAFIAAGGVTLGTLFGLRIFPLEGRTVVPLAGLMIGNAMNATVLTARRTVEELRDKRAEVEARLALGHSARAAARPYLTAALRTALVPQVETTKAVGLVFLPGAMTGLILAGVHPVDAVLVQAVVMFLVLGAVATTSTVIGLGVVSRLFTPDHRLRSLPRPAGP